MEITKKLLIITSLLSLTGCAPASFASVCSLKSYETSKVSFECEERIVERAKREIRQEFAPKKEVIE